MTKKNEVGRREFLKDMTLAGAMAAVVPARPSPLPGMSPGGLLQANRGGDWVRFGHDLHNTRFNSAEGQLGEMRNRTARRRRQHPRRESHLSKRPFRDLHGGWLHRQCCEREPVERQRRG